MPKEDPFVNRAQLLKAIKKYPEIWDSNNKLHMCRSVTAPMWNEIAEQFGGHVPTVKLQSIWSQMKYHYHNLVHRQILHKERFTTKWEHFEPMSFMYNITVAKIIGSNNNNNNNNNNDSLTPTKSCATTLDECSINNNKLMPNSIDTLVLGQGRGRPSGTFTWLSSTPPSPPSVFNTSGSAATTLPSSPLELSIDAHTFPSLNTLVPGEIVTLEAASQAMTHNRKPGRPGSMHSGFRGRIIDAIKMHPAIWGSRQREQRGQCQNRTSKIWREIAADIGLTPTLVQTRWAIIKQRYVDELQKERYALYAHQPFHSTWEHFERMSFMRNILIKKVDEREQTREHIQEIVNEQHQQQLQHQLQHHHQQQQLQLQHHQQSPQFQNVRYARSTAMQHNMNTTLNANAIPSLDICADGTETLCDASGNTFIGMSAMPSLATTLHNIGTPSRRIRSTASVKTEADLEWDPFEMILHVHGSDTSSPNTN